MRSAAVRASTCSGDRIVGSVRGERSNGTPGEGASVSGGSAAQGHRVRGDLTAGLQEREQPRHAGAGGDRPGGNPAARVVHEADRRGDVAPGALRRHEAQYVPRRDLRRGLPTTPKNTFRSNATASTVIGRHRAATKSR